MLPAGTRCPASISASVSSRSIRSKPCMRRLSQVIEHEAGKHARTSGLFQQAPRRRYRQAVCSWPGSALSSGPGSTTVSGS